MPIKRDPILGVNEVEARRDGEWHGRHDIIEKSVAGLDETIVIPGHSKIAGKSPETPVLTDKEYELLKYSSTGLTYEQIASNMAITPKALDHHRTSLFRKLSIQSRQELASIAVKMGLAD